ncbi:hypothetical protein HDV06_007015 [Boothiomyces sp. JEL0866]|nr:hypothetical protein HDV06_007015 [Boothiomyces sp. JEL0866]
MVAKENIIFVMTNHADLGTTGKKTGYWVSEVAHPYNYLKQFYNITFASPKGGVSPVDPGSLEAHKEDPSVITFLQDSNVQEKLKNTIPLSQLNPSDYAALLFPGGHGPMYDLYSDEQSLSFAAKVYENNKVVAALCHGPAAICQIKLSNGEYLIKGKRVTGFSNAEEDAVQLSKLMPYLLEDELKKNGGLYESAPNWQSHVIVDGRLITGQNPASAHDLAVKLHEALQ